MNDFWVVDIEASGLSPWSYPIEVGLFNGLEQYQALICPEGDWQHWSYKAERMHGLSRAYLQQYGCSTYQVAEELNRLVGGRTIFSDHEDWDGFWLQRLFASAGVEQHFIVESLTGLLGSGSEREFPGLVSELRGRGKFKNHRALDDARVFHQAAQLFLKKPIRVNQSSCYGI